MWYSHPTIITYHYCTPDPRPLKLVFSWGPMTIGANHPGFRIAAAPVSQGGSFNGHQRIDGHRFGMLRQGGQGLQQPNTLRPSETEKEKELVLTILVSSMEIHPKMEVLYHIRPNGDSRILKWRYWTVPYHVKPYFGLLKWPLMSHPESLHDETLGHPEPRRNPIDITSDKLRSSSVSAIPRMPPQHTWNPSQSPPDFSWVLYNLGIAISIEELKTLLVSKKGGLCISG